jgi:hypothetical protein
MGNQATICRYLGLVALPPHRAPRLTGQTANRSLRSRTPRGVAHTLAPRPRCKQRWSATLAMVSSQGFVSVGVGTREGGLTMR